MLCLREGRHELGSRNRKKFSTGRSASSVIQKPWDSVRRRTKFARKYVQCSVLRRKRHHALLFDHIDPPRRRPVLQVWERLRSCWQETLRNQGMGKFQVHVLLIAICKILSYFCATDRFHASALPVILAPRARSINST